MCWRLGCGLLTFVCLSSAAVARAEETVAERVDRLIAAAAGQPVAGPTTDAEFCRRIYLDFAGRIPSREELLAFLHEPAPDKRVRLIDALLAGPEYPQHMAQAFHVQLMERLGEHPEWLAYLEASFAVNKPWDQFVRDILWPAADDEARRGAAFFLTKRLENYGQQPVDLPALTRDVGRLFLGVDLQCAQCHDHLFVDDYKQLDFQGLHTFLAQTFIRQDVKFPAVGEKPLEKRTEFASVFVKEPKQTGPRLPFGTELEIPVFAKGEEYAVPPDKQTKSPGQLKFSPLKILSERLPTAENPLFVRNAVNRAWWRLLGRGLVHPLDLQHSQNPPSHPEVLELLAQEFVAHRFDLKWLLRELAMTQTYQRSSVLPAGATPEPPLDRYVVALERPLSPEQLYRSVRQATNQTGEDKAQRERFIKAFANPPREPEIDFAPSVQAALFLMHDKSVLAAVAPGGAVAAESDPVRQIELIYLQVLSRRPTTEEAAEMSAYAAAAADRPRALGHIVWALLTSTEFCLNH